MLANSFLMNQRGTWLVWDLSCARFDRAFFPNARLMSLERPVPIPTQTKCYGVVDHDDSYAIDDTK